VIKYLAADQADQIDHSVRGGGEDAEGGGELVTSRGEGDGEASAVGIDIGSGQDRVADRQP